MAQLKGTTINGDLKVCGGTIYGNIDGNITGNADSATKLSSDTMVGKKDSTAIYFDKGQPVAFSCTFGSAAWCDAACFATSGHSHDGYALKYCNNQNCVQYSLCTCCAKWTCCDWGNCIIHTTYAHRYNNDSSCVQNSNFTNGLKMYTYYENMHIDNNPYVTFKPIERACPTCSYWCDMLLEIDAKQDLLVLNSSRDISSGEGYTIQRVHFVDIEHMLKQCCSESFVCTYYYFGLDTMQYCLYSLYNCKVPIGYIPKGKYEFKVSFFAASSITNCKSVVTKHGISLIPVENLVLN